MDTMPFPASSAPAHELRSGPSLLMVSIFCVLGLWIIFWHEMWRDEWQAWLIAAESDSLADLFRNLRYEGHPGLWHLFLFVLHGLAAHPLVMQLAHLAIAAAAAFLFLRYAPFTRAEKTLFIFGYFPFYEYAAISRNYALGVLGLFAFCTVFAKTPRRYLLLAVILFLLCQTSVYGLMLALVLAAGSVYQAYRDQALWTWPGGAALALILLGVGLSLVQIVPPVDSGFAVEWKFDLDFFHLQTISALIWKAYVPLPGWGVQFWNTNLVPDAWQPLLSGILFLLAALYFIRQPLPLVLYVLGTLGLLTFSYVKYAGALRHHGHLFLWLMAVLWLAESYPPRGTLPLALGWLDPCRRRCRRMLPVLLMVHVVSGVWAASLDLFYPFSRSGAAAEFIRDQGLEGLPLMGHADYAASAVAGCLNRPVYYPASGRWGTFIIWNQDRHTDLKARTLVQQARDLSRRQGQDVLLLLNRPLPRGEEPGPLIQKFTGAIAPDENYYLYRVPRPDPPQQSGMRGVSRP
jgi:hypothetical protein